MTTPVATLDGAHVCVVGASRGIGAEIARASAEAGARRVGLLGRDVAALDQVAASVRAAGASANVVVCDVTSVPSIEAAFDAFGTPDVLVNCAGTNHPQSLLEVTEDVFDELLSVNVRGAFFATRAAVRRMLDDGREGVVVTVTSQMGHVGAARRSVYCATKHALEGMTKALAVELAPHGIRVVSVAPTFVRTELTAAQLDDPVTSESFLSRIPQQRFGRVENVASAVVFAASPAAALWTGSSLIIDGGWTAQ